MKIKELNKLLFNEVLILFKDNTKLRLSRGLFYQLVKHKDWDEEINAKQNRMILYVKL